MWNNLKQYLPSIAHLLGVAAATFIVDHQGGISVALQKAAVAHPNWDMLILAAWGVVLHWAQSPRQKPPAV